MNFETSIPDSESELIDWLKSFQKSESCCNFNKKIVSILKTYMHLIQNVEWTLTDNNKKWDTLEERMQDNFDSVTDKLNQKIELLHVQLKESVSEPLKGEFKKLQNTIDVFRGDSLVSSKKGKIGESQIRNCIESYFPDAEITDQSQQPHQTDYHLKLYGRVIFVEVKTYQKNVPDKEIKKFYRDLEENPEADAGILLSLSSGIANKPKFTYEIGGSCKKPAVFVPNANDANGQTVLWAVLFVTLVLEHLETQDHLTHGNYNDVIEMVQNQLQWTEMSISYLKDLKELSKKHYSSITQQVEKFNKEFHQKIKSAEDILRTNVETWNGYLKNSKKKLLPLPSISQQQTDYQCSKCERTYKVERYYISHIEKCKK